MEPAEDDGAGFAVEVVYSAAAGKIDHSLLRLPPGATVLDALKASGLLERHGHLDLDRLGVWGRLAPADQVLRDRDRVEVYRALLVDPKEARRLRYRQQGGKAGAGTLAAKAPRPGR
jgi:putative ubiquitin-RnfH superfamily antitoxin RatB of RatAB toxin-antitoxin module